MVVFNSAPKIQVNLVSIIWRDQFGSVRPSSFQLQQTVDELRLLLPTPDLEITKSEFTLPWVGRPTTQADFDNINTELLRQRIANGCISAQGCKKYYLGIINPENLNSLTGLLGVALARPLEPCPNTNLRGDVATAYFVPRNNPARFAAVHEFGHILGRRHTNYNGSEAGPCPHSPLDGTVGGRGRNPYGIDTVFGFDGNTVISADTPDLMSYGNYSWISKFTYEHISEHLRNRLGTSLLANENPQIVVQEGESSVLVSGNILMDSETGTLSPIYSFASPVSVPAPATGIYSIRFENSSGQEIASYNFDPEVSSTSNTASFALLLPQYTNTTRILLLKNGQTINSRQASANPPTVTVTFPNGGEVLSGSMITLQWTASDPNGNALTYLIQYSSDGGATWQTIVSDWTSTSYDLNLDTISGTDLGLVRIIASDGFYSAQDQSNNYFSVNTHAPQATIRAPLNNSYFVGDQNIVLDGGAIDAEEGQLSNSALIWTSNLNGSLGSGQAITVNALDLAEGTHIITLTARDSTAQVGTASITVSIYRAAPTIPTTLTTAPTSLNFIAQQGTVNLSQPQILAIRNEGEGILNWSASANQPWIQLGETTGTAPSNAEVRINPSGLALGNYTGTITITTPDATNSPQTVNVSLTIVETLTPTGIVSGKVIYANALTTTSVPFTTLDAVGSIPLSTLTDSNGDYSLSGFASGAYTITPSKTNQVNGISNLDASRVAQHIVGLTLLNANQLIAADTTGNGAVSSLDAAYIAQFVASIPNPGITGTWKFLPASRSYPDVQTNQMNQDYSAILVGDVTGNWNPAGALRFDLSAVDSGQPRQAEKAAKEEGVMVTVQRNESAGGETAMTLNLTATETTGEGILGYQFELLYDAAVIEPQAISCDVTETISRGMTAICHVSKSGVLKVVVFGTTPMSGKGTLLNLKFKVVGIAGKRSPLTFQNFMFNEGLPSRVTVKGQW